MSGNSSKPKQAKQARRSWWLVLTLPVWVYGVFLVVQLGLGLVAQGLERVGVPLSSLNPVLFNGVMALLAYTLALGLVIWLPYAWQRQRTTRQDLGVSDWPRWLDLLLVPAAMAGYMIATTVVLVVVQRLMAVDLTQTTQQLPFSQTMLLEQWHYVVAGLVMVVLAPLVEELLFRGYLYGRLRAQFRPVVAVVVTSLAFGLAHLWAGPGAPLQWMVMLDTLTLSIVMCLMREYTGAIWVPVLMHVCKNGLAFYLLFINPNVIEQLKTAGLLCIGGS